MAAIINEKIKQKLFAGGMIPAHPLALTKDKQLDELYQRALMHYYIDAGADGIAVGVHTTQFEIRDPQVNLYETVLRLAAEEIQKHQSDRPFIKIAGICGDVKQATKEAKLAISYGYDLGLVSMGGLPQYSEEDHLARIREIAQVIPVVGFYLQPSVGGRAFSFAFWRQFMEIEGVYAVKTAPFNRYQTLDVLRAVCHSSRCDEIAVYTGNDDNIVADLLTRYACDVAGSRIEKDVCGGLLGHFAVNTKAAKELFERIRLAKKTGHGYGALLQEGTLITDANAAYFDASHQFRGCIAGINEVLRRQGLLQEATCLSDQECLQPGQAEEITRVMRACPEHDDTAFIQANLATWLKLASQ